MMDYKLYDAFESDDDDDDEIQGYWFNQQPEYRDREEALLLDQQRRLGLEIDINGAREENLGSTRSQTLEMRSPSNQATERANKKWVIGSKKHVTCQQ